MCLVHPSKYQFKHGNDYPATKKGVGNNNIGSLVMYGNKSGGSYGRPRNDGPREMHDVTCSDCGQKTQVPFKPTEGRPVYCRDCYAKHKPKDRY